MEVLRGTLRRRLTDVQQLLNGGRLQPEQVLPDERLRAGLCSREAKYLLGRVFPFAKTVPRNGRSWLNASGLTTSHGMCTDR